MALVWVFCVTMVSAQQARVSREQERQARTLFETGQRYYQEGLFAQATVEWEKSYAVIPRTATLYNLYVGYRDGGDLPNAIRALKLYLEKSGAIEDRPVLEAKVQSMEAELKAKQDAEAERVRQEEATRAAEAEAEQARMAALDAERAAEEARAEAQRSREASRARPTWPWILAGVGGAMLVGGTVTGVMAMGDSDKLRRECPNNLCPNVTEQELSSRRSDVSVLSTTTDILLFGGGTLLATGVVLAFTLDDEQAAPVANARIMVLPNGVMVGGEF